MPTGQASRDNSLIKVLFPGDSSFCHGEKTNLAFFLKLSIVKIRYMQITQNI